MSLWTRAMSLLARSALSLAIALPLSLHAADEVTANKASLSRDQIEQCLKDHQDVVARNQELTEQKSKLDARGDALLKNESRLNEANDSLKPDLAELQRQEDELKRRGNDMAAYLNQATIVKKLSAAYKLRVDAYNADVRQHQVLLDQYNTDVDSLNTQLNALDAKARSTDQRCRKAPVKRADLDAAKSAVEPAPRTTVLTPEARELP